MRCSVLARYKLNHSTCHIATVAVLRYGSGLNQSMRKFFPDRNVRSRWMRLPNSVVYVILNGLCIICTYIDGVWVILPSPRWGAGRFCTPWRKPHFKISIFSYSPVGQFEFSSVQNQGTWPIFGLGGGGWGGGSKSTLKPPSGIALLWLTLPIWIGM